MSRKPHTIDTLLNTYVGVDRKPDECWLWTGATYRLGLGLQPVPRARLAGRQGPARRLVFEAMITAIPPEVHLRCYCGHSLCVNPWHAMSPLTGDIATGPEVEDLLPPDDDGGVTLNEDDLREVLALLPAECRTADHVRSGAFGFSEDVIQAVFG